MNDTTDAHRRALEWAESARTTRARVLDELGSGVASLADVLGRGHADDLVARIKVLPVLEALPGATKVGTRRLLDELGIDQTTPLGELTDDEVEVVLSRFGERATS